MPEQMREATASNALGQQSSSTVTTAATSHDAPQPQTKPPPKQLNRDNEEKAIAGLQEKINQVASELSSTEAQIAETREELSKLCQQEGIDPAAVNQRHINLLHEYNDVKDIGQGLLGLIAEARGQRQVDVEREFGVGEKD
ncbi:hypothetical protein KEM56_007086 [Ascosphaera pollenicola]|nr:hypothetical protein KEM56_007086 [Ascosphaera pollenicola]